MFRLPLRLSSSLRRFTSIPSRPVVSLDNSIVAPSGVDPATEHRRSMIINEVRKADERRTNEVRLSFTVFDDAGEVKHPHLNLTKAELCQQFHIHARDVRPLDSNNTLSAGIYHGRQNLVATILPRRGHCIILNLLYLRAVILADEVVLLDSAEGLGSELHTLFRQNLQRHLKERSPNEPFSYCVLESFLSSTAGTLEAEMTLLRSEIIALIQALETSITRNSLNQLSSVGRDLGGLGERAKLVNEAVERCLADDDLMVLMNLTIPPPPSPTPTAVNPSSDASTSTTLDYSPSKPDASMDEMRTKQEEAELMFESFSQRIEEITSEVQTSTTNVNSTREIVDLMMGATRNGLITLDLQLNYVTVVTGFGTLVAGLFGMNLVSGWEDDPNTFYMVTGWIFVCCLGLTAAGLRRIQYIKRVGMGSMKSLNANGNGGKAKGKVEGWQEVANKEVI